MKVVVRGCLTYGRNSYRLEVERFDQISTVKQKISDKTGVDCGQQGLTFNGRRLEEMRSLSDYDVQNESALDLRCRHCGC